MSDERAPWDKQRGESAAAFEAFTRYRDAGPTRSGAKVARECGKSRSLVHRWSARWNWAVRADAFDRENDRVWRLELQQAQIDVRRRQLRFATAMWAKVAERLQAMGPADIRPADVPRWAQVAADIERKALGEQEETAESPGAALVLGLISEAMKRRGSG